LRGPPNFDRLARLYLWMEMFTFGPWLQRCRCAMLGDITACRHAIAFGDGDGRFTAELLRVNSALQIDAVDASAAMLRELLRRAGTNAARVQTHRTDARVWQPANPAYDLVVSHFFLDCLHEDEIRTLSGKVRGALSSSGLWVVSEFAIPEGAFGRCVAGPIVWLLYRAFALLTGLAIRSLPHHAALLRRAGFTLRKRRCFLRGLLVAELWSAF